MVLPRTIAWRLRRVVRPKDPFWLAYSSLPILMKVASRSLTIAATTFC